MATFQTTAKPFTTSPATKAKASTKIFSKVDNNLLSGYIVTGTVTNEKKTLQWKGAKIPYDLWCRIVSFMRASYQANKAEATGRLMYHEEEKNWRFIVLPQTTRGLHVEEEPDATLDEAFSVCMQQGYEQFGTVHHHCTTSAFQSGTDSHDELTANGVHITVGHVDKDEVDLDIRFVFRGHQYETTMLDWIEPPCWSVDEIGFKIPEVLLTEFWGKINRYHISHPTTADFPQAWLDKISKYVCAPAVTTYPGYRAPVTKQPAFATPGASGSLYDTQQDVPPPNPYPYCDLCFPAEIGCLLEDLRLFDEAAVDELEKGSDGESLLFAALAKVLEPDLVDKAVELLKRSNTAVEDYYQCLC